MRFLSNGKKYSFVGFLVGLGRLKLRFKQMSDIFDHSLMDFKKVISACLLCYKY